MKQVRYVANVSNFTKIQGNPIAYWFSLKTFSVYERSKCLAKVALPRLGMTTADNNKFLRQWFEVKRNKCIFNATTQEEVSVGNYKWVAYNKGGSFRKWYGNLDFVVNWDNEGYEIKHFGEEQGHIRSTVPNTEYYFLECGTWSKISTGMFAMRYRPYGSIFDVAGACLFTKNREKLNNIIGYMNSVVVDYLLKSLSPTMNYEGGQIASLPVLNDDNIDENVVLVVSDNIKLSKDDWDSFETSWDFKKHPLI